MALIMVPVFDGHQNNLESMAGSVTQTRDGLLVVMNEGRALYTDQIKKIFGDVSFQGVRTNKEPFEAFIIKSWGISK